MRKISKRAAIIGAVTALAIGGGVAWAAWSITGTATATASSLEAQEVVVTGTAVGLYPGGSVDMVLEYDNPNPFDVDITSATITSITSSEPGCAVTNLQFAPTIFPFHLNDGTGTVTLSLGVSMPIGAPNECQGAEFDLTANLVGSQSTP
jgi:hypothetical protein